MPLPRNNRLCGATTRRATPCKNPAMANGRCRMHGGASLKGTDLPQFKSGRYSKSMPDRLVGRFREALTDEERHDLRDEIALAEAKIGDLLSDLSDGPPWLEVRTWSDVERWMARKQRLVESDARLARERRQTVPIEDVMALVAALLDSIRRHVPDQATRSALARDIRALGTREAGPGDHEE